MKGSVSRWSTASSSPVAPKRVLRRSTFPTSYRRRAGTCTSHGRASTSARSVRASFTRSSSRVLNHLMRTDVSTTIFAAVARLAIVADDIRGVPLADPLLLQLLERSERLLPGAPVLLAFGEQCPECLTDQLAARASLSLGSAVDLLQEFLGKRDRSEERRAWLPEAEEPPRTSASHRKSHVLPAPQRIEELLHGHDCDSVDTPRAGLKAHADMTLELPLLGKGPQRAHVPGRD